MTAEQSLLDLLSAQMGCMYLSDLRLLPAEERRRLAEKLERMEPGDADLRDWNDALNYLADAPPEATARAAKERLAALLSGTVDPVYVNFYKGEK